MRRTLATVGAALRRRDFRWWFGAQVLSASGGMTQNVALSWVVLQRTGDAFWLSAFTICSWGPLLVLGPWAGALVDRHDRRRLLLVTQSLMLGLGVLLAALNSTGHLGVWTILAVALLFGVVSSVDGPARQVLVVDLVGREAVASAVGLWEVALNASRVLGPALGGALLATAGATWCFLVNAATLVAPLLVLRRLRVPGAAPAGTASARTAREPGAIRAGLRYAWSTPLLRVLLPMAAASGILFTMSLALPTLAQRALHMGGGGYGALLAAFGVGGLPGALLAAGSPEPTGHRVRVLALATGASVLLTAWAPDPALAFAAMALTGLTSIWFIASANTLAQLRSRPEMRGRVMGLWSMALPGSVPLTGVAVAAVIQHLGARAGFSVSGVCLALAALMGWRVLARSGVRGSADAGADNGAEAQGPADVRLRHATATDPEVHSDRRPHR